MSEKYYNRPAAKCPETQSCFIIICIFLFYLFLNLNRLLKNVGIIFEQYSFDYIRHDSKYSMAFSKLLFSNQVNKGKINAILKYILRKKKEKKEDSEEHLFFM